jgi:hypothetical protein
MNQYPQYLEKPQQANQLIHNQIAPNLRQTAVATEATIAPPLGQLDTVALVQTGGITAAIILSIAVLILALAEYNKVFVLMMPQKRDNKTE